MSHKQKSPLERHQAAGLVVERPAAAAVRRACALEQVRAAAGAPLARSATVAPLPGVVLDPDGDGADGGLQPRHGVVGNSASGLRGTVTSGGLRPLRPSPLPPSKAHWSGWLLSDPIQAAIPSRSR